jgi:non-ribosomal peptide synthetase component F
VLGYQAGGALPVPTATAAATAGVPGLVLSEVDDSGTGDPLRSRCADPGEPRYVCFTSGTTGRPKGSLIDHQGMINHLWAKVLDVGMRGDDVLAFTAPPTFDIAIWQMLTPFLLGGTIVVFDELTMSFPRRVLRRLAETGTTAVELVPTMLGWLADVLARPGAAGLPGLRSIMSTGEELGTRLAGRLLEALPGVRLINAYGFTETSDDVTHHVVAPADLRRTRLPVGSPVINTALYVLVPDGPSWRAARPGEPGELFVGGRAPGHGYLDDDRATAAAFFADVIDPGSPTGRLYRTGDGVVVDEGVLCYLGRLDRQVKVSGVRMELGEIEAVLKGHPALAGCAVLAVGEGDERELVAYYVPRTGCDEEQLRDYLADRLPVAMIPRRWHAREELPVSANGKTDYQALRAG